MDNLRSNERIAPCELQQRTDIVIKPADKSSAVVVLSKEDYINEAERQLGNHTHYNLLNADPTPIHTAEIKSVVHSMFTNGQIDKHTKDFLIPHHPRVARFYLLPRTHKPSNPGRPSCPLIVTRRKTSCRMWIGFYNRSQLPFHLTSRTLPHLLTGPKGYQYYTWEPCW